MIESVQGGNLPQVDTVGCISIILVIVLIWYIYRQEYNTACDWRIMDLRLKECDCKEELFTHESKQNTPVDGTMLEKHKKLIDPEKNVMDEHFLGDTLNDAIQVMDVPLTLDGLLVKQRETTEEQLQRNLNDAGNDGPQLEGMHAPITDFENDALSRQLLKQQEVYGNQQFELSEADRLSVLNT